MSLVIEISHLERLFGGAPVLRDVSFQIEAAEVVCLAGENELFESTIFKIITCQSQPDRGSIFVHVERIDRANKRRVREPRCLGWRIASCQYLRQR